MSKQIVLTDLDSTLCDGRHRAHLAALGSTDHADWVAYSKACIADGSIAGAVRAIHLLQRHYPIFAISARNVEAVVETAAWLHQEGIHVARLRLRRPEDEQINSLYKVKYIESLIAEGFEPVLMLEDSEDVVEAVSKLGVPVLRVHPGFDDGVGVRKA
jgi:uncharacterized HAD superfamily protein